MTEMPLHPAVVHFPLVLVFLLPLFAAWALLAIRRGASPARAWALPVVVAAALVASSFVALRTGQAEEERVETVVAESVLHEHEEAAESFLFAGSLVLLVAVMGLLRGSIGRYARALTTIASIGLIALGVRVGAAGGELVYRHGAASVYVAPVDAAIDAEIEH